MDIKIFILNFYLISSIIFTIVFSVLKCNYNFTYFDNILYKKEHDNFNIVEYIFFHIVYYMILGFIFAFNSWELSIVQTVLIELLIAYVEKCDRNNVNWESGITSIIIGLTSYFIGAYLNTIIYYK